MNIYVNSFSEYYVEMSKKNGIGLEVIQYADPNFLDDFNENHNEITRMMDGIPKISMHGSYFDLFHNSVDPLIREVSEKRFMQSVQAASFHGVESLVFHSVYKKHFDGHSTKALNSFIEKSIAFWTQFETNIPEGTTIYIENVEDENPEVLNEIIEEIGNHKVQCCFDIGHAFANSPVSLEKWIDVLNDNIGHVHIQFHQCFRFSSKQHPGMYSQQALLRGSHLAAGHAY